MIDRTKCDDCALAEWKRTAAGKLHPGKAGRCMWKTVVVSLPNSRYFITPPTTCGGFIERGQSYKIECPQYVAKDS